MNRREQFATAAMAAVLSERPWIIEDQSQMDHLAFLSYRMADAMEREARIDEANRDEETNQ